MLIIAYLSCQEAIYLSQYASVLLTNMVILLMQIKWVHEQTHIHMCVVICVVIGLHLWWKDHDFNACLHAPNSKNEEVLRFWPQSDVLWWMLSPLPTQSTANLHFFLGRAVSTPSDTQTEHSNTKEGDKGPPISTETAVSCSPLRIVTYMCSLSLHGPFPLQSPPESSMLSAIWRPGSHSSYFTWNDPPSNCGFKLLFSL